MNAPGAGFWRAVDDRIAEASEAGVLCPITTSSSQVDDGGIRFTVHVLGAARRKLAALGDQRRSRGNPFLDPPPELCVDALSPTHLLVLNKFPVLDRHLLIVTRDFEAQTDPMSRHDFAALGACLQRAEGLCFFNSSAVAGASQEHKHLQLVPLPIGFGPGKTPIEHLLEGVPAGSVQRVPELGFAHAVQRRSAPSSWLDPDRLRRVFSTLHEAVCERRPGHPFNLLVTRDWMMVVPRRCEHFAGISVNALGFAGSLLVSDRNQLDRVRRVGPLAVLASVAGLQSAP